MRSKNEWTERDSGKELKKSKDKKFQSWKKVAKNETEMKDKDTKNNELKRNKLFMNEA